MRISPSSLRISSLLAALKDNTDSDVIDALSYFLLPALDKVKGRPVTASLIAKAANGIYGWNITESIGLVFIERLVARGSVVVEERSGKTVFIAQPSAALESSVDSDTGSSFETAVNLFKQFDIVAGDLIYSQLSEDDLGQMLIRFLISLESYTNESIIAEATASNRSGKTDSEIETLLGDSVILKREEAHVCARFVSYLNSKYPEIARNLSVFAAAGMLAELVEDFRKPASVETRSGTTFFLDGPVLLSLVGVSGRASQEEAESIVLALKSIGCRVEVFTESCREAERVLSAYLKAPSAERHGRTHSAVLSGETTLDYVKAVLSDIEGAAERFGIAIRDYDLESFPNTHRHFGQDRNEDIYSYLAWENPRARDHDAFCVTATMRLRAGRHRSDPLRVSYVMISTNRLLKKSALGPVRGT